METLIYLMLMHSMWLGLILAALTGVVLLFTRNASAHLRYRILSACLFLFAGGMLATAAITVAELLQHGDNGASGIIPRLSPFSTFDFITATWEGTVTYLNVYASYIVGVWFCVIFIKGVHMATGLYNISHLRRSKVYDAGELWQARVASLSAQMGIKKGVRIVQSGLAKAPVVVGHLKPLILIPIGLINNLSAAEVEAIICHELAHIKRKDYLINLLQSVMDVLFFFNPAVIWLNRLIRAERENCCDDMALAANVGVQDYISALVSCREFQLNAGYAMAFAGNKGHLMHRVRRMIEMRKRNISATGKLLLILLVCSALTGAVFFSRIDGTGTHTTRIRVETPEMIKEIRETDRAPEGTTAVAGYKPAVITTDVAQQCTGQQADIAALLALKANGGSTTQGTCRQPVAKDCSASAVVFAPAKAGCATVPVCEKINADVNTIVVSMLAMSGEPVAAPESVCTISNTTTDNARADFTEQDGDQMHKELRTDNIITDTKNTSYQIDEHKLVVNDVEQPERVYRKYFTKYLKYSGRTVTYNCTYKGK